MGKSSEGLSRFIFHLPLSVCHLSLQKEALLAMTIEKWQTENDK
jgi:hypothetical protein